MCLISYCLQITKFLIVFKCYKCFSYYSINIHILGVAKNKFLVIKKDGINNSLLRGYKKNRCYTNTGLTDYIYNCFIIYFFAVYIPKNKNAVKVTLLKDLVLSLNATK